MKNTAKEFNQLIGKYFELKDELLEFTEEFHDNMHWDIVGYGESAQEDIDDINMKELRMQVSRFQAILDLIKNIEYTYC